MNQWIYLAQAATGDANGKRFEKALDALRQAAGRVVIPLASVHYMEIEGNRNASRRQDLARPMEELSGFVCVVPRSSILQVELDAALAQVFGTPFCFTNAPLLGWGAIQAFGRRGGLKVYSEDEGDVTERTRQEWPGGPAAFDAWSYAADTEVTRAILRGPTGEGEIAEMRARGWDPTFARRIARDRAQSEHELAQCLVAHPGVPAANWCSPCAIPRAASCGDSNPEGGTPPSAHSMRRQELRIQARSSTCLARCASLRGSGESASQRHSATMLGSSVSGRWRSNNASVSPISVAAGASTPCSPSWCAAWPTRWHGP